jgi:penicillin-insensitive murein endopeptidase
MRRLAVGMIACVGLAAACSGDVAAAARKKAVRKPPAYATSVAWAAVTRPSSGPARSIGGYAGGCIAGAQPLAPEGTGYQVIRLSRQRNYGHPQLIDMLKGFGRKVAAAGLGTALVGDMGQPRGGPMPSGHASHQIGLDADIWLRLDLPPMDRDARERLDEVKYVDPDLMRIDANWSDRQAQLIRIAAGDPRVARIFVNPAIKRAMCDRAWPDRSFLNKLRPWYGHDGHMHVRLNCPSDSVGCEAQTPPPEGDGCGEELASWFERPPPSAVETPPRPATPRVSNLPPACEAVLRAGGTRVAALPAGPMETAGVETARPPPR